MTIAGARTVVPRSGKIKKKLRMGDGSVSGFVLKHAVMNMEIQISL